ncbi:WD40-repeat-containing domain protein [Camillea tinctor]|nr:WD40-repeat-containing domain protein [Camillea tinctor]
MTQEQQNYKEKLVHLYQEILFFEMNFVCTYFGEVVPYHAENLKDYNILVSVSAEAIVEAEDDLPLTNGSQVKFHLERAFENAREARNLNVFSKSNSELILSQDAHILHKLHAADPSTAVEAIYHDKSFTLPIYQWLVSQKICEDFFNPEKPGKRLLWVNGSPGCGKTMLFTSIVRYLPGDLSIYSQDVNFCYFFCDQSSSHTSSPVGMLRSLIWMILKQQPDLEIHLRDKLDSTSRMDFNDENDFPASIGLFHDIVQDGAFAETYLVVDAIDECALEREDLLLLIEESTRPLSRIRWVLSSRREWHVALEMASKDCLGLDMDLNFPEEVMTKTMNHYISYTVSQLAKKKNYPEKLEEEVAQTIRNTSPSFSWVDTVCIALRGEDKDYTTEALKDMPIDLDGLYSCMIDKIDRLPREDPVLCDNLLSTVAIAYEPMYVKELPLLVGLKDGADPFTIINKCNAFLEHRDGQVRFRNQSGRDYVRKCVLPHGFHETLVQRAFDSLRRFFRRFPVDKPATHATGKRVYALVHWIDHLRDIENLQNVTGTVISFLGTHFLDWLEALREKSRVDSAGNALMSLLRHIRAKGSSTSQLVSWLQDAHFLLRFHQLLITKDEGAFNAISTLIFCPTESVIKKAILANKFPWITTLPITSEIWGDEFRILEGHRNWTSCVTFSPDNRFVISGSHDYSIRVWDVEMGTTQHTLYGHHGWIYCIAVSNANTLASGSDDNTIKIWDYKTGQLRETLNPLENPINAISFSPNGNELVAASASNLHIWNFDKEKYQELHKLEAHDQYIKSIAFSSGGSLLASGGDDEIIVIWDAKAKKKMRTLEGHRDSIKSMAFQPVKDENGTQIIVSASNDNTIRVWDVRTGQPLKVLPYENVTVCSVAFSFDASHIVIGTSDNTIELRHTDTWTLKKVLRGHKRKVLCVACSPDNDLLASGSFDGTVRLWYNNPNALISEESIHRDPRADLMAISAIAITSDGQRIVSCTEDGYMHMFDGNGLRLHEPIKTGHIQRVISLSFSPDEKQIVSTSTRGSLKVFDAIDGRHLCTFEHSDWVRYAVFDPSSRYVISASDDHTVCMWDTQARRSGGSELVWTGWHDNWVRCLAISSDGKYLVSGAADRQVRIWQQGADISSWEFSYSILPFSSDCGIDGAAFYPESSKFILSASKGIATWDAQTNQKLESHAIDINPAIQRLWFDPLSTEFVMTEHGSRSLEPSLFSDLSRVPSWAPYGVLHDTSWWITWKGKKVILIPETYAPRSVYVFRNKVVLGCDSGRTLVFSLSTMIDPLPSNLGMISGPEA